MPRSTVSLSGSYRSIVYSKAMDSRRLTSDVSPEMHEKAYQTMLNIIVRIMQRDPTPEIIADINRIKIEIGNDIFK